MSEPTGCTGPAKPPTMHTDPDGSRVWYIDGQLHRVDGPAVEWADGSQEWYLNDRRHRVDGPAATYADGTREWYLNGQLHRTDGPAVEQADGIREWYLNDKLHRTDGPAVEHADGTLAWYLIGVEMTAEEHTAYQVLSSAEQETALVFLADGMPARQAIIAARCVFRCTPVLPSSV